MPSNDRRKDIARRGLYLNYATLAYNAVEAIVALLAGAFANSVALVSFGFDSVIELGASGAAQWRIRADFDAHRRAHVERRTHRIVGWSFIALAAYIAYDSGRALWYRERPEGSAIGLAMLAASAVVMPLLARAKRHVARELGSRALASEATQTSVCAYLSAIALAGVAANTLFAWWWADPVAALLMMPIIIREGMEGTRRDHGIDCCN